MIKKRFLLVALPLLAVPISAMAGPDAGDKSFTISATGSSDNNFDSNSFGVSGELGYFGTLALQYGIRQSLSGVSGDQISDEWNGSTRFFVDYNFGHDQWRPYIGASLGGNYGESVNNTGAAGLEAGLKYYVLDKTYINGGIEYQWLFKDTSDFGNNVDDGVYTYTIGVGFNF